MLTALSSLPPYLLAQTGSSWLTVWLTPIWYLSAGVAIGLVALVLSVGLFRLLSLTPWSELSRSPLGHVVALVLTALLAVAILWRVPRSALGNEQLQEPLFIGIALTLLCAIVGWAIVFCSGRRAASEAWSVLAEGVAGYMAGTALVVVLVGAALWLVGSQSVIQIVDQPWEALQSVPAVFTAGEQPPLVTTLPPKPADAAAPLVELPLPPDFQLLRELTMVSDTTVILGDAAEATNFSSTLPPGSQRADSLNRYQPLSDLPFAYEPGTAVYAQTKRSNRP